MSESKINIAKAILAVMKDVKGIDKTMTIGSGNSAYKGVPDQEVKKVIGASMEKNGLCLLPISVTPTIKVERWEEMDSYSKAMKTKQSVFTEVQTKYLLLHDSGESIELAGYGHGIDSQDKGAGKATTYALKYALLYAFLVPTGKIDDADMVHSNDVATPQNAPKVIVPPTDYIKLLNGCNTLAELQKAFMSIPKDASTKEIIALKDELKTKLQ
jgi:hypothetical protein